MKTLTDLVKRSHPVVVEELTPAQLSLGEVQRVLQGLLDEQVSIRDLVRIFEALSLQGAGHQGPRRARRGRPRRARPGHRRARTSPSGAVHVISFDPTLEQRMLEAMRPGDARPVIALDPLTGQSVLAELDRPPHRGRGARPAPGRSSARPSCAPPYAAWSRPALPSTAVLSYTELGGARQVRSVGTVSGDRLAVTA